MKDVHKNPNCVLLIPFIVSGSPHKSGQHPAMYMPHMLDSNIEIRIAGSSGCP